jgi:hypothetical protein
MTTKRTTKAKTTAPAPTQPEPQPEAVTVSAESQRPEPQQQPQRLQDAIKAHQNAIDFIHTAVHRTDCAIQLLTRNGYFSTVQHLQQAKVHLRESEYEAQRNIERIKSEMTRPNV